jgi:hypothetical protein
MIGRMSYGMLQLTSDLTNSNIIVTYFPKLITVSIMAEIECPICLCEYNSDGEHVPLMLRCEHSFRKCYLRDNISSASRGGGITSCPQFISHIQEPFDKNCSNFTMISCRELAKRTYGCPASASDSTAAVLATAECSTNKIKIVEYTAAQRKADDFAATELKAAGY